MDTYRDSGLDAYFSRSIANRVGNTLAQSSNAAGTNTINFDQTPTAGSLGDKIQVGGITIDGTKRRIVITDGSGNEIGWIGNIDG